MMMCEVRLHVSKYNITTIMHYKHKLTNWRNHSVSLSSLLSREKSTQINTNYLTGGGDGADVNETHFNTSRRFLEMGRSYKIIIASTITTITTIIT